MRVSQREVSNYIYFSEILHYKALFSIVGCHSICFFFLIEGKLHVFGLQNTGLHLGEAARETCLHSPWVSAHASPSPAENTPVATPSFRVQPFQLAGRGLPGPRPRPSCASPALGRLPLQLRTPESSPRLRALPSPRHCSNLPLSLPSPAATAQLCHPGCLTAPSAPQEAT